MGPRDRQIELNRYISEDDYVYDSYHKKYGVVVQVHCADDNTIYGGTVTWTDYWVLFDGEKKETRCAYSHLRLLA